MTSEELTAQMYLIGENPLSGLDELTQTTFIPDLDLSTSLNDVTSIQPVDDFIINFIQQEQSNIINSNFIDYKNDFNFEAAIEPISAPVLSDEASFLNIIESLTQIVNAPNDDPMDDLLDFNMDFITNSNSMDVIGSPSQELTFTDLSELINDTVTPKEVPIEIPEQTIQSPNYSDDDNSQYSIMSPGNSSSNESYVVSKEKVKRVRGSRVDKRESNKAAATRYRNKKLKERDDLFTECDEYAKKNADLKSKIDDIQTEISFIKSLLVEALISKTKKK